MADTLYVTTRTIMVMLRNHDPNEGKHGEHTAKWVEMLAREIGLSDDEIYIASQAALIHDMGKIAINESLLSKTTKLTKTQYKTLQTHTTTGAELFQEIAEEVLLPKDIEHAVLSAVRSHHEKWNGRGYPDGLKGERIPLYARLISICDALEVLTDSRPYQKPVLSAQALEKLTAESDAFDPDIFRSFVKMMAKAEKIKK